MYFRPANLTLWCLATLFVVCMAIKWKLDHDLQVYHAHQDYLGEVSNFTLNSSGICFSDHKFMADDTCLKKLESLAIASGKNEFDRADILKVITRIELSNFVEASTSKMKDHFSSDLRYSYCQLNDEEAHDVIKTIMAARQFSDISAPEVQSQVKTYAAALDCPMGRVNAAINYFVAYDKLSKNKQI